MRLTILAVILLLMTLPGNALASSPGGACTVLGAQERDSGQLLICNGSIWIETIKTVNAGRSLFQVGPDASSTCSAMLTGRLRYSGVGAPVSGLAAYYPFDETSGTAIADLSGNANNGTMTNMDGATDHIPGVIGNGLDFDGADDHVVVPQAASLNFSTSHSMTLWVRPAAWPASGQNATFLAKRTFANYYFEMGDTGLASGGFYDGGTYRGFTAPGALALGTWYHLAAVFDDTGNTYKVYINGVEVLNTGAAWVPQVQVGNLYIGTLEASIQFFTGALDEIRLYNRALTAGEIGDIYNYDGGGGGDEWQYCNGSAWVDF